MTAPASNDGWVAVQATGGRVLLHLAKPPFGQRTLCGRYTSDRYLPEGSHADAERCGVCAMTAESEAPVQGPRERWHFPPSAPYGGAR
jgi:hypothetical protein